MGITFRLLMPSMIKLFLLICICVADDLFRSQYNAFLNMPDFPIFDNELPSTVEYLEKEITTTKIPNEESRKSQKRYKPEWKDLDTRPLPEWFDRAKFGIMLHWGIYSVPDFEFNKNEFWKNWTETHDMHMLDLAAANYNPGYTYQEFVRLFTAELFDPDTWAELFANAGAKYIILTTRHHDGFTLFPSNESKNWNALEVGPYRDIVGELATAVKYRGLDFGVYYSLYEWYNPAHLENKTMFPKFERCSRPWTEIEQLLYSYEPSILWLDGKVEYKCKFWTSRNLLAWLYNESPVRDNIVVNDRWDDSICQHGNFDTCYDKIEPGKLQKRKWETAFSIDRKSWSYRRNIKKSDILTTKELIGIIVKTVSCGGNMLLSLGPSRKGTIAPIFKERLLEMGRWLGINGEAVYGTSPWLYQVDTSNSHVWYTCTKASYDPSKPSAPPEISETITAIYAIILKWPVNNLLRIKSVAELLKSNETIIKLLGYRPILKQWKIVDGDVYITLPDQKSITFEYAWTLKFVRV